MLFRSWLPGNSAKGHTAWCRAHDRRNASTEHDEQRRVIKLCVEVAKGRAPVIAGTGSNSTAHTIEATRQAKEAGADAALIVLSVLQQADAGGALPPLQGGARRGELPIVIYNIRRPHGSST